MKPEIEAKFLDADHDSLRAKLKELGAVCDHPMRLMKRKNYDHPDKRMQQIGGWVRLRDEGGKITLAYKQLNDRTLIGTHEVLVTVNDFLDADALLNSIGLVSTSYQETKRESWRLGRIEIELDEWPWAKPYVEMEGPGEKELKDIALKLDLDWTKVCHGSVEIVYRAEYNVTDKEIEDIPVITFNQPPPDWLEERRRS